MSMNKPLTLTENLEMEIVMWYNKLLFQVPFHDEKERK